MLDDGNFVLATANSSNNEWESFDQPTDTILPSQKLGSVYFTLKNHTMFNVTESGVSAKDYYQRATLDPDGVFRQCQKIRQDASMLEVNLRSFTCKELEEATDKFKEELGRGAFGIVYKGVLNSSPAIQVALKKLDKMEEELQKEFENEVMTIRRTHHKNLVRVLGFCNEGLNRLLVYEFMSRGSLMGYLFGGGSKPEWHRRLKINFGIARGIRYLHEECRSQIIHCDIKPHNILLDDSLEAKISDFGLAKLLKTGQTRTNTGIRGRKGYVAPEKNVELEMGNEEEAILTDWAYDCYIQGRLDALVNDDEEEDPSLRPPMKKVSQMLDGAVEVAVPPDPSSYISSIH
ncbi:G-type lectin S-receptor-like serine/threonine-protein kinase RLK1 [Acorus calamus]|uniref:non-specific serine/threonine protein kinase n=1 Tax=Acorus calamus TaxID=4465 RepID=A0AAV9CFK7_ACOCL|nr:G-type lectin S-receptor-like serine/threonine-protein kinase RLK1 [Acorus calamus]